MNKKKQYMAPVIKCVEFKIEQGFASSGSLYQDMDRSLIDGAQYDPNYNFDPFGVIRKWSHNEDWD